MTDSTVVPVPRPEPLPEPLPSSVHELSSLRSQVRTRREHCLTQLRWCQQELHRALRSCGAVVHCRLDLQAQEALQAADREGETWLAYSHQLTTLDVAISSQLQREQTGRLM